ncbi:hypothetical protein ADUPG1_005475 [Aduncisulcus paluster]|uniref:SET domain-containing protein n=1 Tax=Aduncisulcus paluster TaxID=2918883 RepID=A0ABQ5KEL8_9EUKA|nr:hypothetical protein ADUPG1_005475 [Aduncisulcus paluster]
METRHVGWPTTCITVRDGLVIDAADVMCPMKYVNHSCSPNAFVQVVGDGFIYRAKTPIKCGREITIDYAHSAETEADLLPCKCGSKFCRGYTASEEFIKAIMRYK